MTRPSNGSTRIGIEVVDTDTAIGIASRNLKGPRDKNLLLTAEALATIRRELDHGSTAAVARRLQVSREIVREFLNLLDLPAAIQDRFRRGALRTLEQGRRLHQLQRAREADLESAAEAMRGMTAHEARDLVAYLIKHPEVEVPEAVAAIDEAKARHTRLFVVVMDLEEGDFRGLQVYATRRGLGVAEAAAELVRTGLEAWRPR
jgi:hypothetical protein